MPDQAAVVFELARKMVEMSPILSGLVKILPSGKRLIGLRKNVLYRAGRRRQDGTRPVADPGDPR
jgi:hypothetical protein